MAILLVACGTGSSAGSSSSPSSPGQAPASSGSAQARGLSTADKMWHDFLDATEARDAVIAGDLGRVKPALLRLSQRQHGEDLPVDWVPWLEEMQSEAARGASAQTLLQAASAVAALGTSCGECHRTTAGGPKWTGDDKGYEALDETGLQEKMARHKWSADELWLGLTGPVHQAWARGAAGLMNINVPSLVDHRGVPASEDRRPTGEGDLQGQPDPDMPDQAQAGDGTPTPGGSVAAVDLDPALREIRALGERADRAAIPKEKQAVFGEVIARCGACHAKLGIEL